MVIELRKINQNEKLSHETNCYTADIYVNGKLAAHVHNEGWGGPDCYDAVDQKLLDEAIAYCKTLPPLEFEGGSLKMDLELYTGKQLEDYMRKKNAGKIARKLEGDMKKGLVYLPKGGNKEVGWEMITWKGWDIPKLLGAKGGPEHIRKSVLKVVAEGCTILNTNLPAEVTAGI